MIVGVPIALQRRWWRCTAITLTVCIFLERRKSATRTPSRCHSGFRALSDRMAFPRRWHGIFQNAARTPSKMILFVKKASYGILTASSQHLYRVQGIDTEFTLHSTAFLRISCLQFIALAFSLCVRRPWCMQCVYTVFWYCADGL